MLYRRLHLPASVFALLLSVLLPSYGSAAEITLATGINSDPPYVYGNLKIEAQNPGITIDILKAVEQQTGVKFNIERHPWARVVWEVKENKLDGGFHFSFKQERTEFIAYPILPGATTPDRRFSISDRSYVLYHRTGETIYWDGIKLHHPLNGPFRIGVIRGSSVIDTLHGFGHPLTEVETDEQLLELLLAKRIDAVVALENMLDPKIAALYPERRVRIHKLTTPIEQKPYYIAFSKQFYRDHEERAWAVWQAIAKLKENGEFNRLIKRYASLNKALPYQLLNYEISFLRKYRTLSESIQRANVQAEQ